MVYYVEARETSIGLMSINCLHVCYCLKEASEVAQMEVEVEVQEKITAAALRLAQDRSRSRSIRKKRIQAFHKASDKVICQTLL